MLLDREAGLRHSPGEALRRRGSSEVKTDNRNFMEYKNAEHLIRKLSVLSKTDATKKLTEFYAKARFRIQGDDFRAQYTDGGDDGGIDFCHSEDATYFIFQTKFAGSSKRVSESEILDELRKLKNTLTKENPNRKAADFVNSLKRETGNRATFLEILWLTTNIVEQSVKDAVQRNLDVWRKANNWTLGIDFVVIDKHALDSVIYDVQHEFIPYTGKKVLRLEAGQWMQTLGEDTNVYSVVCTVEVNDLLKWFRNSDNVKCFLQKNVREFLGEGKIAKGIVRSYLESPAWFWYKHNGVIIFADNLSIDESKRELTLRNPQVVNGGQTLSALFLAYDKHGRLDSTAKVLVRVYRLPYENTETYQRSIEIIAALNSQNKIAASDLHSTDPRQIRIEHLLNIVGDGYGYIRKRSVDSKPSKTHISMRSLALPYYVCKRNVAHEGVRGNVEELFEEQSKYDEVFNEPAINRELKAGHVVLNYVTVWAIDHLLRKIELPQRDAEYHQYSRWFVLADVYRKLSDWKQNRFTLPWEQWSGFLTSPRFETAVTQYSRLMFKTAREMIPRREDARDFFRKAETVNRFEGRTRRRYFDVLLKKANRQFERENMSH